MKRIVKTRITRLFSLICSLVILCAPAAQALDDPGPANFPAVAESAGLSVVKIRAEKNEKDRITKYYPDPYRQPNSRYGGNPGGESLENSVASGFFFDTAGHIVTNYHVVNNADRVTATLHNGEAFDAEIVGSDPFTDLALIRIPLKEPAPTIPLGNSDDLRVGEWVAAIGSPFGFDYTITAGIVSAKGRFVGLEVFDDFIQTDAPINPGSSGGPLLNVKGEVVGVSMAAVANSYGIGFAVPINMAVDVLSQLRDDGEVSRAWLGILVQDLDEDLVKYLGLKKRNGVMVSEVYADNPADKAGIELMDIILEIDGMPVKSKADMPRIVSSIEAGGRIDVKILRKGRVGNCRMTAGRREDVDVLTMRPAKRMSQMLGISVGDIAPNPSGPFSQHRTGGIVVTRVAPLGKGKEAGILAGDIIKEVNRCPVESADEFKRMIRKLTEGEGIRLLIRRRGFGYLLAKLEK